MSRVQRSLLVRWRLGRFINLREECPCVSRQYLSRDHLLTCRALDPSLFDALPQPPFGVHIIDHALNCLPTKATTGPPPFWYALLQLLNSVDRLRHPLATIPSVPDPGNRWFCSVPSP